jgi:hypothetical protein
LWGLPLEPNQVLLEKNKEEFSGISDGGKRKVTNLNYAQTLSLTKACSIEERILNVSNKEMTHVQGDGVASYPDLIIDIAYRW